MRTTAADVQPLAAPGKSGVPRLPQYSVGRGSLGPFQVGAPINDVMALLRRTTGVTHVEFEHDRPNPLEHDFQVTVPSLGLRCYFHSACQRLVRVEAYDLSRLVLAMQTRVVCEPQARLTLQTAHDLFGRGYAASSLGPAGIAIQYEVLSLHFSLAGGSASASASLESEREREDRASALSADLVAVHLPRRPASPEGTVEPCALCADERRSTWHLLCTDPYALHVGSADGPRLALGFSCQEVLSVLGAPQAIFDKPHPPPIVAHGGREPAPPSADYYFNYFALGLDVLFDRGSHTAYKFVLHTNNPGSDSFMWYRKAQFALELLPAGAAHPRIVQLPPPETPGVGDLLGVVELLPSANRHVSIVERPCDPIVARADSRWSQLSVLLARPTANASKPLLRKSSKLFGHGNMLFEVVNENDLIAAVSIFRDPAWDRILEREAAAVALA